MAPRPQKEAESLAEAGYDVLVQGFWFDQKRIGFDRQLAAQKRWRFAPIVDFSPAHRLSNFKMRFKSRIAKEAYGRFGIFTPELLGYGVSNMLAAALKE